MASCWDPSRTCWRSAARDYVSFIDAAVTERLSQTRSLRTYLEEEASVGAETGGRLRNAILTGFGSEGSLGAVREMALVCESSFLMLLRAIGSEAHVLDLLPTIYGRLCSTSSRRWRPRLRLWSTAASSSSSRTCVRKS
eukprot:5533973-Pleurochrysis_carterae.AAC.2